MGENLLPPPEDLKMFDIPLRALRSNTLNLLSSSLNPIRVLPSEDGMPRDWRGLSQLTGVYEKALLNSNDPVKEILSMWDVAESHDGQKPSLGTLQTLLGQLDRWDVYDDTAEMMRQDAEAYESASANISRQVPEVDGATDKHILTRDDVARIGIGLPAQNYDAFLLYAEEDESFAIQMIEKLEKEYGLKLCVKERDLVGGLSFEHEAIMRLIAERCNRMITIFSPKFLLSEANKFIVNYAQAIGIEQRKRKIIPCVYQPCQLPMELAYIFTLHYNRSSPLWNFWEKLRDSIHAPVPSTPRVREAEAEDVRRIRCTVQEITNDVEESTKPSYTGETAVVCMSDPTTLYPSMRTGAVSKNSTDSWVPVKNTPLSVEGPSTSQVQKHSKGSAKYLLNKILPKDLKFPGSPAEKSKPKKKWFPKKKAVALENF